MKFALSLLLLALTSVFAARVPPSHYPADVAALMDFSVDPCDDFYLYSCGTWVNQTVLPPQDAVFERAISGIFANNTATLLAILNNATSSYPKIKDFYDNCLDTNTIEQLGFAPLQKYWDVLTVDNIAQFMDGVGFLHSFQIPAFFAFGVTPDPLNPQTLIGEFDQAGFALPYPGLYNTSDPSSQKILADYQQHIELMFNLAGDSDPASRAKEVIELESLLASVNLPGDQIRDPYSVYHKIDLGGLQSLTPNLPWPAYLEAIGAPGLTSLNVAEPSFFQAANKIIASVSVKTLETHLRWNLLHAAAPLMSSAFANATFAFFNAELSGQTAMQPRSRSCVSATDAALGNILGQAYADVAFGSVAQEMITAMVGQIEAAFGEVLTGLDWMDPDTKAKAQMKLSQVTRRVGAPQQPSFYPDYDVLPNQYLESVFTKNAYDFNQTVSRLGQAPDKDAWQMTADTVNAYYNPQDNSINFPAGILQNPYFDVSRDPAQNFGGAGVIMGHELTHGFDDQGRMYDGNGKLSNWWSNSSAAHYEESSMCMANQYSQFQVLPGVHINGNLTLGENIADNGGVKNSFDAYVKFVHKVRHGSYRSLMRSLAEMKHPRVRTQHGAPVFQEDHPLFFVSYAQGWCAKATDAYLQMQVQTDVHSNFKFRVLGPLMNFQPFADTFECPVDHPMNPKTKCTVW